MIADTSTTPPTTSVGRAKLTGPQRHAISVAACNIAADTAARAMQNGQTLEEAKNQGILAANETAKTYSQTVRAATTATAAASALLPSPLSATTTRGNQGRWQTVNNKGTKKRLSQISPYITGTKTDVATSLLPVKPDHLSNKCLVISGVSTQITRQQFKEYVTEHAQKEIDFRHIQPLSRDGSSWLTIAIELSDDDYATLSDCNIWEPRIRIREFKGWKWWRSDRPQRPSPEEIRSTMRMQWS